MNHDVPEPGIEGGYISLIPNEEYRGDGHDFPKNKQGKNIAGKGNSQGAPHIKKGGHMLPSIPYMEGIDHTQKGHNDKHISKTHAKLVDPAQDEFISQKVIDPIGTFGHIEEVYEGYHRD
ncbi:hypothetical protein ES703_51852 [subsurface metagenome]